MAKRKEANSGSRDHVPGQMEDSCQKWKIERLVKSCTLTSRVLTEDYHSQLPFTTACATISSETSRGTRVSSQNKGRESST